MATLRSPDTADQFVALPTTREPPVFQTGTHRRASGLTLIEVVLAVVIVSILAGIAYPSYTKFIENSRRTDARVILLEGSLYLQRQLDNNGAYPSAAAFNAEMADIGDRLSGYFSFDAVSMQTSTYTIRAVATSDETCREILLSHTGERTAKDQSGTDTSDKCW